MGDNYQNFTISKVFTNTVSYLMMRLTLVGVLQGIYIGSSNDLYRSTRCKPPTMGLVSLIKSWPLLCII
jgi:hypothetical protein